MVPVDLRPSEAAAVWCADVELAVGSRNGTTRWDPRFVVLQSVPLKLELFGLRGQGEHAQLTGILEEVALDSAVTAQGPWRPGIDVVVIVPESLDDAATRMRLESCSASELCSIIALEQAKARVHEAKDVPDDGIHGNAMISSATVSETTETIYGTHSCRDSSLASSLNRMVMQSKVVAERVQEAIMEPAPPPPSTGSTSESEVVEAKSSSEDTSKVVNRKKHLATDLQAAHVASTVEKYSTLDATEEEQEGAEQEQDTKQVQQPSPAAAASEQHQQPHADREENDSLAAEHAEQVRTQSLANLPIFTASQPARQEPATEPPPRSKRAVHLIRAQLSQCRPSAQPQFGPHEVCVGDLVRLSPTALSNFIRQKRGCLRSATAVGTVIACGYLPRSMPGLTCGSGTTPEQTIQGNLGSPLCRVRLLKPRTLHTELDLRYQRTKENLADDRTTQHCDQTFWYSSADLLPVAATHSSLT